MSSETTPKCPFAISGTTNRDWWPNQLRLDIVTVFFFRQQFLQPFAKGAMRFGAARQPAVQDRLRQILAPLLVEQVGNADKIEHVIADGDAGAPPALAHGEDAERQVLDRKVAILGAVAPAFHGHGSLALGKPVHA